MPKLMKLLSLIVISVTVLSGCTKRKTSVKPADRMRQKIAAAKAATAAKASPANEASLPAIDMSNTPTDEDSSGTQQPMTEPQSTSGTAPTSTSEPTATPPLTTRTDQEPPQKPVSTLPYDLPKVVPQTHSAGTDPAPTPDTQPLHPKTSEGELESCIKTKTPEAYKQISATSDRPITPTILSEMKLSALACPGAKEYAAKLDQKIADIFLAAFPGEESVVQFFLRLERMKISDEDRKQAYDLFGCSEAEIESKGVQFFGPLEGAKTTKTVISYLIQRYNGNIIQTTCNEGRQKKTTPSPKDISVNQIRYIFDFSQNTNGFYPVHIGNGEYKLTAKAKFMNGSLNDLQDKKTVTMIFSLESWESIIKDQLGKLLASQMKNLLDLPFDIKMTPENSKLVRTCNLNIKSIACTDPDFIANASVTPQGVLKLASEED